MAKFADGDASSGDPDYPMVHLRSPEEVEKIRHSAGIVARTLDLLGEMIEPGVKPKELDTAAENYIRSEGAVPGFLGLYDYPATLCVSVDHEVVHGIPGDRPLKEGQIVSIDCGALADDYYGDHARTFAVGAVAEELQALMDHTQECLKLGIAAAQLGNRVGDIGHVIQTHAEKFGYGVVRELVGHGIGTRLHEEPQVPNYGTPGSGALLKEGMCLALEPMINLGTADIFTGEDGWTVMTVDGKASAHFEHTIVITADGPEILSVSDASMKTMV